MKPEDLKGLRECCQNNVAFERMKQILLKAEAEQHKTELETLLSIGEQLRQAGLSTDRDKFLKTLEEIVGDRTTELLGIHQQLQPGVCDRLWADRIWSDSEQQFQATIETAIDITLILDSNGQLCYCSPSITEVLGYFPEELIGHHITDFVPAAEALVVMQIVQKAIASPGINHPPIQHQIRHCNGSWHVFESVATSLLDDPVVRGVVITCHNATQRSQAKDALRAANRRIINVLESVTDAFIWLNSDWQFVYLNHQAVQLFQQPPVDLIDHNIWEAFPELVGSTLDWEAHRAVEQHIPRTFEEFYPSLNTWFEVRVFPSIDGLLIFFLDVTERRYEQAELLEMSTALGNAVEGIARLDTGDRYIALNRAYAAALGYEQAEMIGLEWQQTIHPDDIATVMAARQRMLVESKAEFEVRGLRKNGSTFYQAVVIVAAHDWHNHFAGHHCFTKDITERKRIEEAQRQQAERERLIRTVAQRIHSSLHLEEILNTTVSEVRQFFRADRVVIYRLLATGGATAKAESVERGWPSILEMQIQDDWFKQRQEDYRERKKLMADDVRQLDIPKPFQEFLQRVYIQAFLAAPIFQGNQLWGLIAVHQCSKTRHWASFERDVLEELATQVAIAIQQSELYHQIQQLNTELENQVQERTAQLEQALHFEAIMNRITEAVRDSLDEDKILQTAVQELVLGLNLKGCSTALHDFEQQTIFINHEFLNSDSDLIPAQDKTMQIADFSEICDRIFQSESVQFCRIIRDSTRPMQNICAILACPIVDDQEVLGDLWLFKSAHETFSEQEIQVVQQVASQCAIAIRQARLYQSAQVQVATLEELNRLKDDFLSTVSHELRTPMSNMHMAIHMLKNVATPERQERYLNILQTECIREIELINDLLDLQRLEASSYPVSLEIVDLQACLLDAIEPFHTRAKDRQQRLQLNLPEKLPAITTDRASFERILAELLNNACKYTPPEGSIVLEASQAIDDTGSAQVVISVSNQAEIPDLELSRIFDKFYRVPKADRWKQGGTGLGLALVKSLIVELQGTIHVNSGHGWTRFIIQFPLAVPSG